jgi:light-regulated signal transduction histidine kinase (bacteriophytochrome)
LLEKNALAISEANRLKMSSDKEFIVEFLYRIKHANGGYRWMQTFGTIFNRNKNGKVEDVINISIDVTDQVNISDELKAKHRELEETNSKLAHKNKELEAFTYIASHDLQEPLRKIKFFVQQIQDGQTTTTGSNYNARVSSEVSRMQHMINGLLEYSQMTKEDNAPFEQIGLGALLAEIKNGMADELNEKQAIIQISQLPVLRGIRLQLYQLFSNLIHNSLKYSRTGVAPTIHIYSEIVEMPGKLPNASSFIKITHADNGIGFENEYAEYIFELFRRLHSKNAYSGTGIGLTICKRILENHSGFIEATGIPDQGATFNMYFPVD